MTKAEDGIISVVGVHVASHDDTRRTSPKKGEKKHSLSDFEASVRSDLHGHSSYCLVCEIARVPQLVSFLQNLP